LQEEFFAQVFVSHDQAYILTMNHTLMNRVLHKIDISEPSRPVDLGSIVLPDNKPTYGGFDIINSYIYWFMGNSPEPPSIEIINVK
jgi:hypothetical protein